MYDICPLTLNVVLQTDLHNVRKELKLTQFRQTESCHILFFQHAPYAVLGILHLQVGSTFLREAVQSKHTLPPPFHYHSISSHLHG